MKRCSSCKTMKTVDNFYSDSRRPDGLQSQCAKCQNETKKAYVATSKYRITRLTRDYGHCINFTDMLDRYFDTHNCECCGNSFGESKFTRKCVDHKGDIIRGILCGACNRGIGLLGDTKEALKDALNYLELSG